MYSIAWGAKVSRTFLDRVMWIVGDLGIGGSIADGTNKLMTCMAWESGRSFSASKKNLAGSGATGLIQFMPSTAKDLGTTTAALAKMTPEDQLNYVWHYFKPHKGKLRTLADLYMAILWPKAVGKPEDHVLWTKATQPTTFRQNAGLDKNRDARITKAECAGKVMALLDEGLRPGNVLVLSSLKPEGSAPIRRVLTEAAPQPVLELTQTDFGPPEVQYVQQWTEGQLPDRAPTDAGPPMGTGDTATAIKNAISGWGGNFGGIIAIIGALVLNPDFTTAVGQFFVRLSRGEGGWGALVSLIGAGAIAYRHRPKSTRP